MGLPGTDSVIRTWSWFAGTWAPPSAKPAGASFIETAIGPAKPSWRSAYTVSGTVVPPRTLMLDGTTRSAKSGSGALIRRR